MAAILFLDGGSISLDVEVTRRLARLGVTSLALLADDGSACLVMDGWSFDLDRSCPEILQALAGTRPVRLLRPHVQMSVITDPGDTT